jgi:nucleotide-binding universal stress UspA family protein
MLPIKTILHPTDFSTCSRDAFRLACSLARDHGARMVVLHVTSVPDLVYIGYGKPGAPVAASDYVAQQRRHLEELQTPDPAPRVERRLVEGDPIREILCVANETDANIIITGTHGQTGIRHLLLGNVAEQIIRQALCPVLTLKITSNDTAANS